MYRSSNSETSIPDAILFSSDSSSTDRNVTVKSANPDVERSTVKNRNSDIIEMPLRGYTKWEPNTHGSTLVWRDVSVYANLDRSVNNCRLKRIINNSSGAIQPGTLMALMGSRLGGFYLKKFIRIAYYPLRIEHSYPSIS